MLKLSIGLRDIGLVGKEENDEGNCIDYRHSVDVEVYCFLELTMGWLRHYFFIRFKLIDQRDHQDDTTDNSKE